MSENCDVKTPPCSDVFSVNEVVDSPTFPYGIGSLLELYKKEHLYLYNIDTRICPLVTQLTRFDCITRITNCTYNN